MKLLKIILELISKKSPKNQYYLNIGAYFLKKGSRYRIGQIIKEKKMGEEKSLVNVITGMHFNFDTYKISYTVRKRVIRHEKGR